MSKTRATYTAGPQATRTACFNCESGQQVMGKFGSYCFECETYNPTGIADEIAEKYFDALQAGDSGRVASIKLILDFCEALTIKTAKGTDYPHLAALAFDCAEGRPEHAAYNANTIALNDCNTPELYARWVKLCELIAQGTITEPGRAVEYLQGVDD